MTETKPRFVDLEPPPGGLQRLQRRLHAGAPSAPAMHWLPLGATALGVGLLALLVLPGMLARQHRTDALARSLHAAIAPSAQGVRMIDGAAIALPGAPPGVSIYLLQAGERH